MADTSDYTGLITNEHSDKPKYMAMVGAVAQPLVDALNVSKGLPEDFDLDKAIGVQLDQVGLWIGVGRRIDTPLTGVYFSFDTIGVGFDQGVWKGPFDPDTGIIDLDDETYRLLLRAKIAANHWDGTMETSKAILDAVFNPGGGSEFVEVAASNEIFALGDGVSTAFQLRYQGQPMLRKIGRLLMMVLLVPMLLASGCATKAPYSPRPSVAPARIPPLSPEARQPPAPQWCSPTCSHGLMNERENWRKRMMMPR